MSPENIETVRVLLDAWGRGEGGQALAQMSEDVEFDASARPDGRIWRGKQGVSDAMREWVEIWEEYTVEFEELIDAGPEVIVSLWHESGRARHSGALISQEGATVFALAGGLVSKVTVSVDRAGVLAGLGLSG